MNSSPENPPSSSDDPLVVEAMRPLKLDAESTMAAQRLLTILREDAADQADAALRRWSRKDGKARWQWLFHFIAAAVSSLMLVLGGLELRGYMDGVRSLAYNSDPKLASAVGRNLTHHQQLLLGTADPSADTVERTKELWQSDPSNAAYFFEYAGAFNAVTRKLPPDFSTQVAALDPTNAYPRHWEASVILEDAVVKRSKYFRPAPPPPGSLPSPWAASPWEVKDPAKVDQALEILHQCRELTRYQDHAGEVLRERIPLMRQDTLPEYLHSLALLSRITNTGYYSSNLSKAIAAKAWLFGENGDAAGMLSLIEDVDASLRNCSRADPSFAIKEMFAAGWVKACLTNLIAPAGKLGLAAEAAKLQERLDRVNQLIADRKAAVFQIEGVDAAEKLPANAILAVRPGHSSTFHFPVLTDAEVRPARMIEHEFIAQFGTLANWGLLAVAAVLILLYRFRSPRLVRGLAKRMEQLLRPADWAWLMTCGIPAWVYTLLIIRLTPWGGTDFNMMHYRIQLPFDGTLPLPLVQFAGTGLMLVILPILIARWRLGKRATIFGFHTGGSWQGWLALACAAAFIPTAGWAVAIHGTTPLVILWTLFAIPTIWILAVIARALFTSGLRLLHFTTVSRVLVPAYAAGMVALLLTIPWFKEARQYWFERDQVNRLDPAYPSWTKFEYEVSVAGHKELQEALGYDR